MASVRLSKRCSSGEADDSRSSWFRRDHPAAAVSPRYRPIRAVRIDPVQMLRSE
jgi:hypothetical protein